MLLNFLKERFNILFFIFTSGLLSGIVLIGINSSFSLMLSERGVKITTISTILVATIPYAWKFVISPFVKNIIVKFSDAKFDIVKTIAYISQFLILLSFSTLGLFNQSGSLILAGVCIFLITVAISIHDIISAHVKLTEFESRDLGMVSSISNTGFRIGMLISGACMLYLAESFGWKFAFFLVSLVAFIVTISTLFIPRIRQNEDAIKKESFVSLKKYVLITVDFFKKYGVFLLIITLISFKFSDNCISLLKPLFLRTIGVSKITFANISQIPGVFTMIFGGIIAGIATYKIGTKTCIKLSFYLQAFASSFFLFLSYFDANLAIIASLVNASSLIFGFTNVIFRTFIAEESKKDVNIYMILMSIGSLLRIASYYIGGFIVDTYSWHLVYVICIISNIPGIYLYTRLSIKNRQNI